MYEFLSKINDKFQWIDKADYRYEFAFTWAMICDLVMVIVLWALAIPSILFAVYFVFVDSLINFNKFGTANSYECSVFESKV